LKYRSSLIALAAVTAALYFAKAVLIPLALAILFSFLLAPAVRRFERWMPRIVATLLLAVLVFSLLGAVAVIAGKQAVSLAAKLPEYRENITGKIRAVREPQEGELGRAADAIKDLQEEAAPERPPLAVKETPGSAFEAIIEFIAPFVEPVGTALAVIVFTILMLLNRENMVERLIALIGPGRIHLMTRALNEASYRVSRYLYMQLIVNTMFGVPFGIALYFIGVPNAMLWGMLGVLLRFIPYAGVWVAVAMPALLAFAISDSWSMVAWTIGVFLTLELLLVNAVEPYLYGRSAGLTPIAIIAAAVFWTWLWGPIGLLLATPLTVCVTVIGRYVPEFGYLNVLLGVEPVLSPDERFYQRLVALELDEATEIAEKHVAAHGLIAALDEVLVPALGLAGVDRRKGTLEPARERYIFEAMRGIVEELPAPDGKSAPAGVECCIVPAHDEADRVAAQILALAAPARIVDLDSRDACATIIVSAVAPQAASHAATAARRLHSRFPEARIVVALWAAEGDLARPRERLGHLGVDAVVSRVADAIKEVQKDATRITADDDLGRSPRQSARSA
jgi:predicted PurR-regulated permease PerM